MISGIKGSRTIQNGSVEPQRSFLADHVVIHHVHGRGVCHSMSIASLCRMRGFTRTFPASLRALGWRFHQRQCHCQWIACAELVHHPKHFRHHPQPLITKSEAENRLALPDLVGRAAIAPASIFLRFRSFNPPDSLVPLGGGGLRGRRSRWRGWWPQSGAAQSDRQRPGDRFAAPPHSPAGWR